MFNVLACAFKLAGEDLDFIQAAGEAFDVTNAEVGKIVAKTTLLFSMSCNGSFPPDNNLDLLRGFHA